MRKNTSIVEDGIIAGNLYNKYETRNPAARLLMNNFLRQLKDIVVSIEVCDIHEIGCGEGYLSAILNDLTGRKIRASDCSEKIIIIAKELHKNKNIDFKTCSVYDLDLENDSAELIVCSQVLEHLQNSELTLEIIQKLAKPYALFSVPREPTWRILNLLRGKYLKNLGNTPGHIQHWSKQSFVELLEKYFQICTVRTPFPWIIILCKTTS